MLEPLLSLAGLFLLSLSASAQEACSTLKMGVRDLPGTPERVLQVAVGDAPPLTPTWLALARAEGTTAIDLGASGILVLGLEPPFAVPLLGLTDESGRIERAFRVPTSLSMQLYGQAVSARLQRGDRGPILRYCTSNVASVEL